MQRSKDLFLFRLNKLSAVTGRPLIRLCEGKYSITRREWRLIVVLAQEGALLSTELARMASIEPARTSRAVTILVTHGLAERVPRPNDRRCVEIHLTDSGHQIFQDLYPVVEQLNAKLLSVLSTAEREQLEAVFARLENAASDLSEITQNLPKVNRRRN